MRLTIACLARNEADRYWRSALSAWSDFADRIIVMDDDSYDDTPEMAEEAGADVFSLATAQPAWGQEALARQDMWRVAYQETEPGEWIFVLDADMVPISNPRAIFHSADDDGRINALAFRLFDLWDTPADGHPSYRDDEFWRGHMFPRVWAVKRPASVPEEGWLWPARGIHCGHFPDNMDTRLTAAVPESLSLLHYGWATPEIRKEKVARYLAESDQLSDFELRHVLTARHSPPEAMKALPFTPQYPLRMESENV